MSFVFALAVACINYSVETLLIRWGLFAGWSPGGRFLMWVVVVIPQIEEFTRVSVANFFESRGWIPPEIALRRAVQVGLWLGMLEFITKGINATEGTAYEYAGHLSSFPIHVALSVVFFSRVQYRFRRTLGAHVLLNTTVVVCAVILGREGLSEEIAPGTYTLAILAGIAVVSGILTAAFKRRFRQAGMVKGALPSERSL